MSIRLILFFPLVSNYCQLFLAVPRCCLRFVIVVFPDHTHFLFLKEMKFTKSVVVFVIDDMITQEKIQKLLKKNLGGRGGDKLPKFSN